MALVLVSIMFSVVVQESFGQPCPCADNGAAANQMSRNLSQLFYPVSNPMNVLVAYDEECTDIQYMTDIMTRALYRFPWKMQIAGWVTWDSDDSKNLTESLYEVEGELPWYKGKVVHGVQMDLCVAWSGQDNDNLAGVAKVGSRICLIKKQTFWADDNTVQEEVTHLFGVYDHCFSDDCVMSRQERWWYFIWEDLTPVESRSVLVAIFNWQKIGYISTNWCVPHYQILTESEGIPLSVAYEGAQCDDILVDDEINPPHEPPKEELNPPTIWTYLMPVLIVALPIAIVLIVIWIIRKRRKSCRLH